MILLVILGLFTLITGVLHFLIKYDDGWGFICIIGIVFLGIAIIAVPISRYCSQIEIAQFNETRRILEDARINKDISTLELATIQKKVIEENNWLIENKIWKKNVFVGIYTHPNVLELEPIK